MRRCVLSLIVFLSVGCAKPPVDGPPDLNSWLTVYENEYTFGDGCVVSVQESKNTCHSLQVESGRCNKMYQLLVERTWRDDRLSWLWPRPL